jgi:hypothetical protein
MGDSQGARELNARQLGVAVGRRVDRSGDPDGDRTVFVAHNGQEEGQWHLAAVLGLGDGLKAAPVERIGPAASAGPLTTMFSGHDLISFDI